MAAAATLRTRPRIACLVAGLLALECAGFGSAPAGTPHYEYFATPSRDDPWSSEIRAWQAREAREAAEVLEAPAPVSGRGASAPAPAEGAQDLRSKYLAFRRAERRALARELVIWMQAQAREHYIPDGPIDRWATLEETLARNGDDCDGLELLAYRFLLDMGYGEHRVYRAIVYHPSDGQHHMVTLWFEDPADPWVLDPTGAMSPKLARMSELPDWVPIKVFSEHEEFSVRQARR